MCVISKVQNQYNVNMTEPYFLQMIVSPPDLVLSIIKTYTQNLRKQNEQFATDIIQMELSLARHSQKLENIQQMKIDKNLRQNILWELQSKELAKMFPNILAEQKQKHPHQKSKKTQNNENKSFHLRTIKNNVQPHSKLSSRPKFDQNIRVSKNASKEKQPQKDQNCLLQKQNISLPIKSPYGANEKFKNSLKGTQRCERQKIYKSGLLRKASAQLIFAQKSEKQQGCKIQPPKREMLQILSGQYEQDKKINFTVQKENHGSKNSDPYHCSRFKNDLGIQKAYNEDSLSKRAKNIQIRRSLNKAYKGE